MSEKHVTSEYAIASCQYNDLTGTATADALDRDPSALESLAKKVGIDTNEYQILSVSICHHFDTPSPYVSTTFCAVRKSDSGDNYDDLLAFVRGQEHQPTVTRFSTRKLGLEDVLAAFKRFNMVLQRRDLNISGVNLGEDVDLDA